MWFEDEDMVALVEALKGCPSSSTSEKAERSGTTAELSGRRTLDGSYADLAALLTKDRQKNTSRRRNPASGNVSLRFSIPTHVIKSLRIHDVAGRHVRTLATDPRSGEQDVIWDGRDDQGRFVASGTYFVRLQWPEGTATSRVMLLR